MPDLKLTSHLDVLTDWWDDMGVQADQALVKALAGAQTRSQAAPKAAANTPRKHRKGLKSIDEWVKEADTLAANCGDLPALKLVIEAYAGSPLKDGALNTVVSDGVQGAPLMVIGEGPGAQEDRKGLPFIGKAGQLLDKMLAAIGYDRRENAFITNVNYWRPPSNRNPEAEELAVCRPFVDRIIELGEPSLIIAAGGVSAKALLRTRTGIMKLRGSEHIYQTPGGFSVPLIPIFHPAYLLRRPQDKSRTWRDLLLIQDLLEKSH